jgi:hypothetical protein
VTDPRPRRRGGQSPPPGLSLWASRTWSELLASNDFAAHELVTFTRALKWWDVSDTLLIEGASLTGRARDQKFKAAGDAATTALRFWRSLKFATPVPARRPGRPGKTSWTPRSA